MKYGGPAIVERGKTAVDRGCEVIRLGHAFAVGAERLRDACEIPPLALAAGRQP
jgi:hypothetical protein